MTEVAERELRRSSPDEPGWRRLGAGRGFTYVDAHGRRADPAERERFAALAIPPAWRDVWICADPGAHLQAVGVDAAGRRQYVYHPEWVQARAADKYDRVLELGERLGRSRVLVGRDIVASGVPLERACATAFRILDLGALRVGNDAYADEDGGFGLTTLERRHARRRGTVLHLDFVGKSGVAHHVEVDDVEVLEAVQAMRRRRHSPALLSYRARAWANLNSGHVNTYIREITGLEVSAKDFRTWHATVAAARTLTIAVREAGGHAALVATRGWETPAWETAAALLGNTPAQARESYVDPRVVQAHAQGDRLRPWRDERDLERAVLDLVERTR